MTREELAKLVGGNIATERGNRGHKQAWLAARVPVSRVAVSMYENGHRMPSLELLMRFAAALDCTLIALLTGLYDGDEAYRAAWLAGWRACAADVESRLTWEPKPPSSPVRGVAA